MKCANCGTEQDEGLSFCTNCGEPLMTAAASSELGASLESAVQANQDVIGEIEAHGQLVDDEVARLSQAQAEVEAASNIPPVAEQGYVPPSYGSPQPPSGYQSVGGAEEAAGVAAAAGAAAAAPFYQQDVSPNAHYSSQRSYENNAYGQDTGQAYYQQPSYQQPSYNQGAQAQPQQVWPAQSATKRAFCMTLYIAGLIGLIFGLCVRDKDDEFVTHHLNNVAVITIGAVIASFLSAVIIGIFLAIYLLVMAIMGIVSAYKGDMSELPLIGKIHIVK